jgi:hypothetical protein
MGQKITFTDDRGRDVNIVCRESYNKGKRWLWLLKQSIQKLGLSRSIVVDKNNNVLCGNKQAHIATELGIKKARVVETTGDELIIVKRIDVDVDSAKSCEISLTDNLIASKILGWDVDAVLSDMSKHLSFDARQYEGYECVTKELDISELLKDEVSRRPKKREESHIESSVCHSLFLFD